MLGDLIITEAAGGGHAQIRTITAPGAHPVTYSLGAMSKPNQSRALPQIKEIA